MMDFKCYRKHSYTSLFLAVFVICQSSQASEFKCALEHHRENAVVKTGASICGEFNFVSNDKNPKRQKFEKCQSLLVTYEAIPISNGVEHYIEMKRPSMNKTAPSEFLGSTNFAAKVLPSEFRVESRTSRLEKKHVLDDTYILSCHQSSSESSI